MKRTVAVLLIVLIVGIVGAQTIERYTSIVLWFDLRSATDSNMQKHLDSFLYRGYTIASTVVFEENLYIFLQARLK